MMSVSQGDSVGNRQDDEVLDAPVDGEAISVSGSEAEDRADADSSTDTYMHGGAYSGEVHKGGMQVDGMHDGDVEQSVRGEIRNTESVSQDEGSGAAVAASQKRKWSVVAMCAAVLVVVLVVAGVLMVRGRGIDGSGAAGAAPAVVDGSARSACQDAQGKAQDAHKAFEDALAGAKDALAVTAGQVADAGTVDALAKASKPGVATPVDCAAVQDADGVARVTAAWESSASQWGKATDALSAAASAVTGSRDALTLRQAKDTLQGQLADGHSVLDSTNGKVADPATRVTLTQALDAGQAAYDAGADADAMSSAANAIYSASAACLASQQQAEQQAAAAAAAAQAQKSTGASRSYGTNRSTGTTSGTTSRKTTSAGSVGSGSTGATSSGSGSGSSSSGSINGRGYIKIGNTYFDTTSTNGGCNDPNAGKIGVTTSCGTYDGYNHNEG